MKILVLTENYPSNNSHNRMYIHIRCKYYKENNIDVTVLSFKAKNNYTYEGINVITYESYKKNKEYDLLCIHAPNIKHHYKFINKYNKYFKKIVYFFHGHEILKLNKDYPKEYSFRKNKTIKRIIRSFYDEFKIKLLKKQIYRNINKSHLVFVSNYLYNKFIDYTNLNKQLLKNHISIINNSVGEVFEENTYDLKVKKEYDFITIRGENLDDSKYGIDIVSSLANKYPKYNFLIIGKGDYFKYNNKSDNITFINNILFHKDMIEYLNKSKFALMPTRHDTQGVLSSEFVSFGIPLVTSNLPVTKEMFSDFDNAILVDDFNTFDLDSLFNNKYKYKDNKKFYRSNTIEKEIKLFEELL